jgi:uncharacterized glyoxalase superfamily protein PhnB
MATPGKPIPDGYHTITPHVCVNSAAKAIEFYKQAFGAEELFRMPGPGGKVMHAEIMIGDCHLMLNDEFPEMGTLGPQEGSPSPVVLHLYVNDVDASMAKAEKAGAKVTMPASDMFWGDRYGQLQDPFGHRWSIATHKEDLSPEEIGERAAKAGF